MTSRRWPHREGDPGVGPRYHALQRRQRHPAGLSAAHRGAAQGPGEGGPAQGRGGPGGRPQSPAGGPTRARRRSSVTATSPRMTSSGSRESSTSSLRTWWPRSTSSWPTRSRSSSRSEGAGPGDPGRSGGDVDESRPNTSRRPRLPGTRSPSGCGSSVHNPPGPPPAVVTPVTTPGRSRRLVPILRCRAGVTAASCLPPRRSTFRRGARRRVHRRGDRERGARRRGGPLRAFGAQRRGPARAGLGRPGAVGAPRRGPRHAALDRPAHRPGARRARPAQRRGRQRDPVVRRRGHRSRLARAPPRMGRQRLRSFAAGRRRHAGGRAGGDPSRRTPAVGVRRPDGDGGRRRTPPRPCTTRSRRNLVGPRGNRSRRGRRLRAALGERGHRRPEVGPEPDALDRGVASISSSPLRFRARPRRLVAVGPGRTAPAERRPARRPPRRVEVATSLSPSPPGSGSPLVAVSCFELGRSPPWRSSTLVVVLAAAECYAALRRGGKRPATLLGLVATVAVMVAPTPRAWPPFRSSWSWW